MSNGAAKCRMEQLAKCRMEQPNVEWNSQNNAEWNSQMSNGIAKCRMEQPNVEWNSQESNGISCSHGDDHDVNSETDLARNRATATVSLTFSSKSEHVPASFVLTFRGLLR